MKSSKILNKSEDCSGFNNILRIYNVNTGNPNQLQQVYDLRSESEDRHAISESKFQMNVQCK